MPSVIPKVVTVGTSPVLLLPARDRRVQWTVIFPSTAKISGNTGNVWVGVSQAPQASAGNSAAQHQMSPGEDYGETDPNFNRQDPTSAIVSKDAIYAISDTASQTIEVIEVIA